MRTSVERLANLEGLEVREGDRSDSFQSVLGCLKPSEDILTKLRAEFRRL